MSKKQSLLEQMFPEKPLSKQQRTQIMNEALYQPEAYGVKSKKKGKSRSKSKQIQSQSDESDITNNNSISYSQLKDNREEIENVFADAFERELNDIDNQNSLDFSRQNVLDCLKSQTSTPNKNVNDLSTIACAIKHTIKQFK